jgi:NAD(P)-dependent dehydrogenase (short-subunit alcohol dehydrogenase family)
MIEVFVKGSFAGKNVFVAGGSGGINLGIAVRFAELGANVSVISRNSERIAEAVKTLEATDARAMGAVADVRDYSAVAAALWKSYHGFGPIDVLVSGAAGNFLSPVLGLSPNAFRTIIEIDLIGTFNVFRASWDHLRRPGASLIAISAGLAQRATPLQAHACAAKAGVNLLTQTLAMEWGPAGIRVNAIAPGPIEDTVGMSKLAGSPEDEVALKKRIPLRNYGTKSDVANMAVFLSSDWGAYVTGAVMDCDGGAVLGDSSVDALKVPPRSQ